MLRTQPANSSVISSPRRPRTVRRISLAVALAVFAALVSPFTGSIHGFAATLESKRAEANRIAAQIDANDTRISVLDEQYNGAVLRIAELNKSIHQAKQRLNAAKSTRGVLRDQVRSRAAALYMGARSGTLFPELDAQNAQQVASRSSYAAAAAQRDSALLSNLRSATAQLTIA